MRVSTIPYNFQSGNFEHVNKQIDDINFGPTNLYKFSKSVKHFGDDGTGYESTSKAGEDISVEGNIYSTSMHGGVQFTRVGTWEATGVFRVGPELDGDNQVMLKDTTLKNNNNLTSTWLGDVIGVMYRYSASGSHGEVNSGRVNKIGLCYIDPSTRKIVTYYCRERISGITYGAEPDNKDYQYSCATMLDTGAKNLVIDRKLKYVGIVCEHFHRHTSGSVTLTGRLWNVRPIINSSKATWVQVKEGLAVNGNSSGRKIVVPHPNTTWSQYSAGEYQILTF